MLSRFLREMLASSFAIAEVVPSMSDHHTTRRPSQNISITMKLMSHSEGFISKQQTAFVKKRQITDNISAVMMAIEEVRNNQTDGMILALDQSDDKARWD
jgi:aminopeptidase-like protein